MEGMEVENFLKMMICLKKSRAGNGMTPKMRLGEKFQDLSTYVLSLSLSRARA